MIFLILTIIGLTGFSLLFFKGVKEGKYDQEIAFLEEYIRTKAVNRKNFDFINKRFMEITNCDKKRTRELFVEFSFKYKSIWHEVVGHEDYLENSRRIAG